MKTRISWGRGDGGMVFKFYDYEGDEPAMDAEPTYGIEFQDAELEQLLDDVRRVMRGPSFWEKAKGLFR